MCRDIIEVTVRTWFVLENQPPEGNIFGNASLGAQAVKLPIAKEGELNQPPNSFGPGRLVSLLLGPVLDGRTQPTW